MNRIGKTGIKSENLDPTVGFSEQKTRIPEKEYGSMARIFRWSGGEKPVTGFSQKAGSGCSFFV
jgi:hypothetical protein